MFLRLNFIYVKNESTNVPNNLNKKKNERAQYFYNYVEISTKSLLPLDRGYSVDFWG